MLRSHFYLEQLDRLKESVGPDLLMTMNISTEKGASSWLTALPIDDMDYHLSKREYWDAVRIRYAWPINMLPSRCACGDSFDLEHALTCKKGCFIVLRHDDFTADILEEVCNVAVEPTLEKLTG